MAQAGRLEEALAMADDESLVGGFRVDIRLALARAHAEAGDHPASRALVRGLPDLVKAAQKGWPDKKSQSLGIGAALLAHCGEPQEAARMFRAAASAAGSAGRYGSLHPLAEPLSVRGRTWTAQRSPWRS